MSLRWRISLFFILSLLVALLAQFGLGWLMFRRALLSDLATDLGQFAAHIELGLNETPQGLTLSQDSLLAAMQYSSYANGSGQVLDSNQNPVLLIGTPFPEDTKDWMMHRKLLSNGYTLEVIMNPRIHSTFLRRYVKVSLLGLPILIFIFGVSGFLLSWQLLNPLVNLQRTLEKVTASGDLKTRVILHKSKDELSHLAQSYNAMMTKLEQFFERERAFTRYASHELRNPLTALHVQVDSALAGDTPPEKVLPTLKRELRRLSTILDGLLILSRDQSIPATLIDLAMLARASIDCARVLVDDKPLIINYHGPNTLVFKGDQALLSRMIDNLLENAVKYSDAGQVVLGLTVTASDIQMQVSDQGIGVPLEALVKLTTPFFRVKQKQGSGVGLGLSVVEQIVKAHSGTLRFENLKPTGFAVTVTFPKST